MGAARLACQCLPGGCTRIYPRFVRVLLPSSWGLVGRSHTGCYRYAGGVLLAPRPRPRSPCAPLTIPGGALRRRRRHLRARARAHTHEVMRANLNNKRWHSEHPLVGITPRSNSVPLAASPLACCKTLAKCNKAGKSGLEARSPDKPNFGEVQLSSALLPSRERHLRGDGGASAA